MAAGDSVVVVTGCTAGLGYYAVKSLASSSGAATAPTVVLACRNVKAARAAADGICKAVGASRDRLLVLPEPLDLSDLASVRAYAAALRKTLGARRISALVNNAGIGGLALQVTGEGYEKIFCTNHLGHALLTILLIPQLATDGCIVNVSSDTHDPHTKTGAPDLELAWPASDAEYESVLLRGARVLGEGAFQSGYRYYSRSKLCNVLFTQELARRMSGAPPAAAEPSVAAAVATMPDNACCALPAAKSVRVLALDPGLMLDSGFFATSTLGKLGWVLNLLSPLLRLALGRRMHPVAMSGAVLANVATGQLSGDAPSGTYISDGAPKPASAFARSLRGATVLGPELWARSLAWAALTPAELKDAGF